MKISFWFSAVVLYAVKVAFSNSVQVGTVLFTTEDLVKRCWTESDKSLLKARLIMQDVLPDPDCIDFSKPEAAVILLDYFHACFQIIGTSTYGKLQNLMYLALSDALGGYLRAYVLPYTRRAYYSGQIQYSDAKRLFQLYDDIRCFLKTNGVGWAEPQKIYYRKLRAKPLIITGGALEACNQLYTIESGKLHCINSPAKSALQDDDADSEPLHFSRHSEDSLRETPDDQPPPPPPPNSTSHPPPRNLTRPRPHRGCKCDNIFRKKSAPLEAKRVVIPLPVLDDCCAPNSIAVPFRRRPLRNLAMRDSAFILEYYYIAVIKCFVAKGNTRTDIKNFNGQFHAWLVSQVFPRLSDEKWYPAFGGVLRVMETIRKFGAESTAKDPILHDIAFMFGNGVGFDVTRSPKLTGKEKVREAVADCSVFSRRHYVTAVLLVSLIWLFIFCTCAFYCQATRGRNLLYEGCSEGSSRSRGRRDAEAGKSKFINFEFLVRFFRRKEDCGKGDEVYQCSVRSEKDRAGFWESVLQGGKGRHNERDVLGWVEQERRQKERGRLVMTGQGDVPLLVVDNLEKVQNPFQQPWQQQQAEGEREAVQTLWRKPLKRQRRAVKDEEKSQRRLRWSERGTTSEEVSKTSSNSCSVEEETRGSSSEKRSSACCCSEDCQQSNSVSTKSSSRTQVDGDVSSGTMEFFEKVVGREEKSSTQESTSESESEGEDSYSSESDY